MLHYFLGNVLMWDVNASTVLKTTPLRNVQQLLLNENDTKVIVVSTTIGTKVRCTCLKVNHDHKHQ